jgi:putative hydrolase of the HAD superfamily
MTQSTIPARVRAIFFDAGGTLLNLDAPFITRLIKQQFDIDTINAEFARGQSLAMATVARLVAERRGSTEQLKYEFYCTLLPRIGVPESILQSAVEAVLQAARDEMLWRTAAPDSPRILDELRRRGYKLAVVSNSDGRIQSAFVTAGIGDYFEFFVDSFLVRVEKPSPAIFELAAIQAGISPDEAAYVGDLYPVDVVGARAAGLLPILFDPFRQSSENDCLTISTLDELLGLFKTRLTSEPTP